MRCAWVLVGVAILTSCPRAVSPDLAPGSSGTENRGPYSLGMACGDGTQCASGACIDNVCCERACAESQTCARPGHEGLCENRIPGDPCTAEHAEMCGGFACVQEVCCTSACDQGPTWSCNIAGHVGTCGQRENGDTCTAEAQCPSGHCVDGVCCESSCTTACYSCAVAETRGTCTLAPENSDPRGDCTGQCLACFSGLCLPALPGSNPQSVRDNGCPGAMVCAYGGTCGLPLGAECDFLGDGGNVPCANGRCEPLGKDFQGVCTDVAVEELTGMNLNPNAQSRSVVAMALSDLAHPTLLVLEEEFQSSDPTQMQGSQMRFARLDSGSWRTSIITANKAGTISHALLSLTARTLVVKGPQNAQAASTLPATVATWIGPEGVPGGQETVTADPELPYVCRAELVLGAQSIYAVLAMAPADCLSGSTTPVYRVLERGFSSDQWRAVDPAGMPSLRLLVAARLLEDQLVAVDWNSTAGTLHAFLPLRPAVSATVPLPSTCMGPGRPVPPQQVTIPTSPSLSALRLAGTCAGGNRFYQASLRLAGDALEWELVDHEGPQLPLVGGGQSPLTMATASASDPSGGANRMFFADMSALYAASMVTVPGSPPVLGTATRLHQGSSGDTGFSRRLFTLTSGNTYYVAAMRQHSFEFLSQVTDSNGIVSVVALQQSFDHDPVLLRVQVGY